MGWGRRKGREVEERVRLTEGKEGEPGGRG
jgi:hypothetical protein